MRIIVFNRHIMEQATQLISKSGGRPFGFWRRLLMSMASIMMLCAIASPDLSAQQGQIEVKGKVTSQGEPVIGAGVLVKGTTTGTATDMDGNFVLNVRPDAVLTVSSIGYTDAEVSVNGRGYI